MINLVCPLCRTILLPLQEILDSPRGHAHLACLIRRQPMIGPHSGA
jgi:hypothetical protein